MANIPEQLDREIGAIIDRIMVVNSIEEIPPLSEEAAAVLGKPEYQDPSLGAQLSDVRDQVRLHAGLRKGLIQISQTEWGADGSALAAISQEIGALITPDVEAKPQLAPTLDRLRKDTHAAIEAKRPQ